MKLSKKGAQFIEGWEGLRLNAYQDVKGVWTIGIGHTKGVKKGHVITRQRAMELFAEDVEETENAINRLVKVFINQDQFDVLVSLVFNIGWPAFRDSTLLVVLNRGDLLGVPQEIARWNMSGGKRIEGLLRRRWAEGGNWIGSMR